MLTPPDFDADRNPPTIIERGSVGMWAGLKALWQHRDLVHVLAVRDIKLRYQHTFVGFAWVLLQPLSIMLVLTMFASVIGVKTGPIPYPLFVITGLVPWMYFTHGLTSITHSLAAHGELIAKIWFPRLAVPLAAAIGGTADFLVAALLLPAFMLLYGVPVTPALFALPLFVLMAVLAATATGLWLAVLNVRYRDVMNALPFVMQLLFFATPISYSSAAIPEPYRTLSGLNPMTGVVEGVRWAVLGDRFAPLHPSILVSVATISTLLITGLWYFHRREPHFADDL